MGQTVTKKVKTTRRGPRVAAAAPLTPAEAMAQWEKDGIIGTLADRPADYARQLREEVWKRGAEE